MPFNISALIQEAKKLQQTFHGDPQQAVQQLLNSGQMSQEQFNQYAMIANQVFRKI